MKLRLDRTLIVGTMISVMAALPATASASHRHHYRHHHLARVHGPMFHVYPALAVNAAPVAPIVTVPQTAVATQSLYAYPALGQSEEQQAADRFSCHTWASNEAGFDPVAAGTSTTYASAAAPPATVGPKDPIRGAAGGAALGAIGGAIAGDPGMGAAIGAALGGTVGLANQSSSNAHYRHAAAQNSQLHAAYARGKVEYQRAISACLVAKGYTVS